MGSTDVIKVCDHFGFVYVLCVTAQYSCLSYFYYIFLHLSSSKLSIVRVIHSFIH